MLQPVNAVVRVYAQAFDAFREEWTLSPLEEEAYHRLIEAYDRIEEFEEAAVDDLHLQDAVRLAHKAMKWPPKQVPEFSCDRPGVKVGEWWPLNSAIISYSHRMLRHCRQLEKIDEEPSEEETRAFEVLSDAYYRILEYRNAKVDDLPLLAALQDAHRITGGAPWSIPQVDVSRRYEGYVTDDGIDVRDRIRCKKDPDLRTEMRQRHIARGLPPTVARHVELQIA